MRKDSHVEALGFCGLSRYDGIVRPSLERDLQRYLELLVDRFGDDLVTLGAFGSQITGRATPESDLDLLLVIRGLPRSRMARRRLLSPVAHAVSEEFADTISTIFLTPEEAKRVKPFYLGFLDGHRLLVDRDGFFRAVLDRLERRLIELGSRRLVDEHGEPYWDLKPDYKLGEDVIL
jgi:predicted nucleotidyltransferase